MVFFVQESVVSELQKMYCQDIIIIFLTDSLNTMKRGETNGGRKLSKSKLVFQHMQIKKLIA